MTIDKPPAYVEVFAAVSVNRVTEHTQQRATDLANWILGLSFNITKPIIDTDISAQEANKVCSYIRVAYQNERITEEVEQRLLTIEHESKNPNELVKH